MHPFDADTRVEPLGEHRYGATLSKRWALLSGTPNGGYLIAVCLRALLEEMPFPDPLAVSAFFLRPAQLGPAEISVELARSGRTMATGEARLVQDGGEVVRLVASCTDLRQAEGRTTVLGEPPRLPPPEETMDVVEGIAMPAVSLVDQMEYRMTAKPGWIAGTPSGNPRAELWMRFREPRDPDLVALAMLADAVAPVIWDLGEFGSTTLELTVHLRAHPAPGWLACRAETRYVTKGYHEEDFEIWDSTGTLVAQSRQLAVLR